MSEEADARLKKPKVDNIVTRIAMRGRTRSHVLVFWRPAYVYADGEATRYNDDLQLGF
jgi:hypothetical protein